MKKILLILISLTIIIGGYFSFSVDAGQMSCYKKLRVCEKYLGTGSSDCRLIYIHCLKYGF